MIALGAFHVTHATLHRKVGVFWARIIDASEILKYIVWLGIHAKLDGDCNMSLSCKISALLAHERNWLTLTASREDQLTDQYGTSQIPLPSLGGSCLLADAQEERTIRRGRLLSTMSSTNHWTDDPIHTTKYKPGLSVMDASKDLLIVP
jgi:hypothetical protein